MPLLHKVSEHDKPGVGTATLYTNRLTRRVAWLVLQPADNGPRVFIDNPTHAQLGVLAVAPNAGMLRAYAQQHAY